MEKYEFYSGITNAGKKVRPSNWAERIALLASTFGKDKRLQYNNGLIPVLLDGQPCLRINEEVLTPEIYAQVIVILKSLDAKKVN